jgi:hypothetical protein
MNKCLVRSITSKVSAVEYRPTARFARRPQSLQTIVARITIPALILTTAGCSLRQDREATSPIEQCLRLLQMSTGGAANLSSGGFSSRQRPQS